MFEGINLVAVLGTTFFMMASATVWFSPLMFGKQWLRELKVTETEIEASRKNIMVHLGLTALAYLIALIVLAQVVLHLYHSGVTLTEAMVAMSLLVVAVLGNISLWENRSRVYFLINVSFYLYFVVVGMLLIKYWPW